MNCPETDVLQDYLDERLDAGAVEDVVSHVETCGDCHTRLDDLADDSAADAPAWTPGGTVGRYRLEAPLAGGGMGVVWRAIDTVLGRTVALKTLLPALAAWPGARVRFLREARAQAALNHENVVPIYDVGKTGLPFIAMPLLEGQTLAQRLLAGPLSPAETARIGRAVAAGLAAAHAVGLIHRDIKPGNIWLQPDGGVKLLDFGLARAAEPVPGAADATITGMFLGTPAYASPEQLRGEQVGEHSDIWSLGVVLYECLAGKRPFAGVTPGAVAMAIATGPESLSPAAPPALRTLIGTMMHREPKGRPASVAAVVAALEHIATNGSRRWMWATLIVLAFVGAVVLAGAIIRVETPAGTLLIETDDPDVTVTVRKDGAVIKDKTRTREITLQPGAYEMTYAEGADGLRTQTAAFEIRKNDKVTVSAKFVPVGKPAPAKYAAPRDAAAALLKAGAKFHVNQTDPKKSNWVERIEDLPADAKLDWVEMGKVTVPPSELATILAAIPSLEEVVVGEGTMTEEAFAILAAAPCAKRLRNICLYEVAVTDSWLRMLASFTSIETVHIVGRRGATRITKRGMSNVPLSRLRHIEFISTDMDLEALDHFSSAEGLTDVTLDDSVFRRDGAAVPLELGWLKGRLSLNSLRVNNTRLPAAALPFIRDNFKRLTLLALGSLGLTDSDLATLGAPRQLDSLILDNNPHITIAGLNRLNRCESLTFLEASKLDVSDAEIRTLSAANPKLTIHWNGKAIEGKTR